MMPNSGPKSIDGPKAPEPAAVPTVLIDRPLKGVSLLNRARYWAARRELEAYVAALRTQNEARKELIRAEELKVEYYGKTLILAENLDTIRATEKLKVTGELEDLLEEREIKRVERRGRLARTTLDAIEAENELDRVQSHTGPSEELSPAQRVAGEIKRISEEYAELKAALIASAAAESVDESEIKDLVESAEVAKRNKIQSLLEGLT